jgi:hypothetical protein
MAGWSTPLGTDNEHFEVLRDHVHFGEGRAGERVTYKTVVFKHPVVNAEVFLSGFNMFYTRQDNDHEVMHERVDAWVDKIGVKQVDTLDPRAISVKLMYHMADEDTSHSDDYNDCYIGFTVLAHTKG